MYVSTSHQQKSVPIVARVHEARSGREMEIQLSLSDNASVFMSVAEAAELVSVLSDALGIWRPGHAPLPRTTADAVGRLAVAAGA